jgi:O-antigen ligase
VLVVLLLSYVWRIQDLFAPLRAIHIVTLGSAVALLMLGFSGRVSVIRLRSRHPVFVLTIAILLLMFASIPSSVFPGNSFRFITDDHIKTIMLMVMLVAGISSARTLERLIFVQLLGATLYSLVILTRFSMVDGRLQNLVYYDPNDLAMLLVCVIPFAVYFMRSGQPNIRRVIGCLATVVLLLAIVKTGSRGGFLGLVAVVSFMLLRFRFIPTRTRWSVFGLAAVLFVLLTGNQYWELMSSLMHPTEDYNWAGNAESGRIEVWKRGLNYMAKRPVIGVGVNSFYVAEGTLSPLAELQQFGRGLKWSAPHNSFVQIGAELGVTGLIVFLLLLRAAYRAAMANVIRDKDGKLKEPGALGLAFAASITGFVVSGFFLSQAYAAFLYTLLGMIVAYAATTSAPNLAPVIQAPARRRGGGWTQAPPDRFADAAGNQRDISTLP